MQFVIGISFLFSLLGLPFLLGKHSRSLWLKIYFGLVCVYFLQGLVRWMIPEYYSTKTENGFLIEKDGIQFISPEKVEIDSKNKSLFLTNNYSIYIYKYNGFKDLDWSRLFGIINNFDEAVDFYRKREKLTHFSVVSDSIKNPKGGEKQVYYVTIKTKDSTFNEELWIDKEILKTHKVAYDTIDGFPRKITCVNQMNAYTEHLGSVRIYDPIKDNYIGVLLTGDVKLFKNHEEEIMRLLQSVKKVE